MRHLVMSVVCVVGLASAVSAAMVFVGIQRGGGGRAVLELAPGMWTEFAVLILRGPIRAGFPWFVSIVLLAVVPRQVSGELDVRGSVAAAALLSVYWVSLGWMRAIGVYLL